MDKEFKFLEDGDEKIIDAQIAKCMGEGNPEKGIWLRIGDDRSTHSIVLSKGDLEKMLFILNTNNQ